MNKRQLIDEITAINQTAQASFLARFEEEELGEYLHHLQSARSPRLMGDASRYAQYFTPRSAHADNRRCTVEREESASLATMVAAPLFH